MAGQHLSPCSALHGIESKLPSTGTTIFTVMSQLAAECGALNLSQGFPEFEPDGRLVELVTRHMQDGANQYAPMMGVLPLREALAEKARQRRATHTFDLKLSRMSLYDTSKTGIAA